MILGLIGIDVMSKTSQQKCWCFLYILGPDDIPQSCDTLKQMQLVEDSVGAQTHCWKPLSDRIFLAEDRLYWYLLPSPHQVLP